MSPDWPAARLFEHHDDAYRLWRDAGVRGATLVHVDAHPDMSPCAEPAHLHIGNFVHQAIQDGIVAEVVWVAPDQSFSTADGRRRLAQHFAAFAVNFSPSGGLTRAGGVWSLNTTVGRIMALPMAALPRITGPALVDVDTDYFMIDTAPFRGYHRPRSRPWIWPADVLPVLHRQVPSPSHVTVAASVGGGFVPLEWKFLADLIASGETPAMTHLLEAARCRAAHRHEAAVRAAMLAAGLAPESAAPWHLIALSRQAQGRVAAARRAAARATALDPSYRGLFASDGYVRLRRGELGASARAFAAHLARDPHDAGASLGLGLVALAQRRWRAAVRAFDRTLALDATLVLAYRGRAQAFEALGRLEAAHRDYGASLRAALAGGRMVHEPWISDLDAPRRDDEHARTHAALAAIDWRLGRRRAAAAGFRMAIAAGDARPITARRLARAERAQP